jgi:hypothetical protein
VAKVKLALARYTTAPSLRDELEALVAPVAFARLPMEGQAAMCEQLPELLSSLSPPVRCSVYNRFVCARS